MSQPEMLPVVEVVEREFNAVLAAKRESDNARWLNWGRSIGLLTRDTIQRTTLPSWQWDDYSI